MSPNEPLSITPLRSLFARGDAWVVTGDLFRRDADGDYWRVDGAGDVIDTDRGPVFTTPIRDALGAIPAVDLALAYGLPRDADDHEVAVAAVTLRPGRELTARAIGRALGVLESEQKPALVYVVERIPVTTWYRPLTGELRAAGIPEASADGQAWYLDASGQTYRVLTAAARQRLTRPPKGVRPKPKRGASRPSTA